MPKVPNSVRRVVEAWLDAGRPAQPPIAWPRDRWLEDFAAHAVPLSRLPGRLDRRAIRAVGADAARSPEQAVDAFLAVMAWGYGDDVGYGRFRTARILGGRPDAPLRLHAAARAVVEEGAIAGYRALASTSRLEGLGPAFGTKLLYFWQPADARPRALIFDAFVAGWLNREVDLRIDSVQWSVAAYSRYLARMHEWASALGIEPDELEMCIFRDEASRRGSQWGGDADRESRRRIEPTPGAPLDAYPQGGRVLENSPDASTLDPGVAGASARREYERRVAGREARVKGRFGRRIGGVILALSDDPQSTRAWGRGSEGEEELANALADVEGIRVLHDRRVPGTRGNIDHIVVAPGGVFVVDAKRYEGTIRVRDVGGLLRRDERLYVGRRDCSRLAENMKWQVEAVEHALASVQPKAPPVTPVLCFVRGEWPLVFPPTSYRGVRLEGTRSIKKLVLGDQVLEAAAINRVTDLLSGHLPPK